MPKPWPEYEPSEEEIARQKEAIKAGWSEAKRRQRKVQADEVPWRVPVENDPRKP